MPWKNEDEDEDHDPGCWRLATEKHPLSLNEPCRLRNLKYIYSPGMKEKYWRVNVPQNYSSREKKNNREEKIEHLVQSVEQEKKRYNVNCRDFTTY